MNKKYVTFFVVLLVVFCDNLFCTSIRDEDELIQVIKRLHVDFSRYDDITEYIKNNCETLQKKETIKTVIKTQLAELYLKNDKNINGTVLRILGCLALSSIFFLGFCAEAGKGEIYPALGCTGLAFFGLACYVISKELQEPIDKVYKLKILRKSF